MFFIVLEFRFCDDQTKIGGRRLFGGGEGFGLWIREKRPKRGEKYSFAAGGWHLGWMKWPGEIRTTKNKVARAIRPKKGRFGSLFRKQVWPFFSIRGHPSSRGTDFLYLLAFFCSETLRSKRARSCSSWTCSSCTCSSCTCLLVLLVLVYLFFLYLFTCSSCICSSCTCVLVFLVVFFLYLFFYFFFFFCSFFLLWVPFFIPHSILLFTRMAFFLFFVMEWPSWPAGLFSPNHLVCGLAQVGQYSIDLWPSLHVNVAFLYSDWYSGEG